MYVMRAGRVRHLLGLLISLLAISQSAFGFTPNLRSPLPLGIVFPEFIRAETTNPAGLIFERTFAGEVLTSPSVGLSPLFTNSGTTPYSISLAKGFSRFGIGADYSSSFTSAAYNTSSLGFGAAIRTQGFSAGLSIIYPFSSGSGYGGVPLSPVFGFGAIIGRSSGTNGAVTLSNFTGSPANSNLTVGLGYSGDDKNYDLEVDLILPAFSNLGSTNYSLAFAAGTYVGRVGLAFNALYSFSSLSGGTTTTTTAGTSGLNMGMSAIIWITRAISFQIRYNPLSSQGISIASSTLMIANTTYLGLSFAPEVP